MRRFLAVLVLCAGPVFADVPELPRILIDTTYRSSTPGATTAVASGANLQTAINAAACGDTLELEAGATFTGTFTLPDKDCTDATWVYIRTSTPDSLLPQGRRVTPDQASLMAKLSSGTTPTLITASDADHYRLVGLEIVNTAYTAGNGGSIVDLSGGQSNLATQTNNIIIDRCYIHPEDLVDGHRRGVSIQGAHISVINSHVEAREDGFDSQAIASWNGSGPFKIVNNYLEAAGENVMFGGSDPSGSAFIPSDIEIRRNHFFKPREWNVADPLYDGSGWDVKNLFELKNAMRVLFEGNLVEQCWPALQSGWGSTITVRNQQGSAPYSTIQDVTYRGNWIRKITSWLNFLGEDDNQVSVPGARWSFSHNLITDLGTPDWDGNGSDFEGMEIGQGPGEDFVFKHNTQSLGNRILYFVNPNDSADMTPGFIFSYNIAQAGTYGIWLEGGITGQNALAATAPGYAATGNVTVGYTCSGGGGMPVGNFCPANWAAVGMENYQADSSGDYRLDSASTYYGTALGGADPGVWFPAMVTAESQLDWSLDLTPGGTSVTVTFGVPGLPDGQNCNVRYGDQTILSTAGANTRAVEITGLTVDQHYFIGVDCGDTWGGWLDWDGYTATADAPTVTVPITYTARPPAQLATAARMLVECSEAEAMTAPTSAQDTSCTSAAVCEVSVQAPVGTAYCRHTYQTSGDVALAVSKPQAITVVE